VKIKVRAIIYPTEDEERVIKCINNFFNLENIEVKKVGEQKVVIGTSMGHRALEKLYHALRREKVLDAARQYIKRGKSERSVVFYLNKQVAYVGRLSFASFEFGESPLGAIVVEIETSEPNKLIRWLTPRTKDGKPIEKVKPPDDP